METAAVNLIGRSASQVYGRIIRSVIAVAQVFTYYTSFTATESLKYITVLCDIDRGVTPDFGFFTHAGAEHAHGAAQHILLLNLLDNT